MIEIPFGVMFWTRNPPILMPPRSLLQFNRIGHPCENPNGYGTYLADLPVPHDDLQLLCKPRVLVDATVKTMMMVSTNFPC